MKHLIVIYIFTGILFQDTAFSDDPIGFVKRFCAVFVWPIIALVGVAILINEHNLKANR